jgi:PAS domain S-box-containing protein
MNGFNFDDKQILECILDTMMDGVMVVDINGRIISFNRGAEKITGYKAEEVVGRHCTILDTDACSLNYRDKDGNRCLIFSKGKVSNKRCQIRNKRGETVHLLKNAVILKDKEGKVFGAVETLTDITSLFLKDMELKEIREQIEINYGFMGLIGMSQPMQKVFELIQNAADSEIPIMIFGESGTGKEIVANAIHLLSRRSSAPFVKVNCAALNESLLESELFGHRKGSFTGALNDRRGRFEVADGGSIFLDEIGDMPLSMQVKLLRVLQEKEIERVGEQTPIRVDVRIITATNKDLHSLVVDGKFREDLYYRVNVFPIYLPPLRERIEDLPLLINHFLKNISIVNRKKITTVKPEAVKALKSYHWPGNVRQLINTLEYASITCKGDTIGIEHLPDYITSHTEAQFRVDKIGDDEKSVIISMLRQHKYNRTATARALGISRVSLWKKMKKYGLIE